MSPPIPAGGEARSPYPMNDSSAPRRLRILLVGAGGVIGRHVLAALAGLHDVISAGLEPARGT